MENIFCCNYGEKLRSIFVKKIDQQKIFIAIIKALTETVLMTVVIQAIKYVLISLTAGIIEFLSFSFLVAIFGKTTFYLRWIEFTSLALSCIYNYIVNRKVTFKAVNNLFRGMLFVAIFYLFFFPFSMWFVPWLVEQGVAPSVAKLGKMSLNFVLEFSLYKFVIFRGDTKTDDPIFVESEPVE